MTAGVQQDVTLRNAQADAITTRAGTSCLLRIYDGTKPASCATALSGNTKLSEHTNASTFAPAASGGVLSPTLPANVNALASSMASFYRLYKSDGTTCFFQDDVVSSSNGLILNPSNNVITSGQPVIVTSWTITMGGA